MNVGSLFSGIGGFDLGLERAGFSTAWFCEQDDYCTRVLGKHWPRVPVYPDITELKGSDIEPVDVLCGGFPCQDLSVAGKGAGITGARSGLWSEYARLIGELRPRYVIVENVSALLGRGLSVVLGDLSALGYDAEWDCIPASAVGAPHQRDRIWIVAYPNGSERTTGTGTQRQAGWPEPRDGSEDVAHPASVGQPRSGEPVDAEHPAPAGNGEATEPWDGRSPDLWSVEPAVGRVADGVPARMDRLACLGNALVPQIAEWIGHRIIEWEAGQ